MKKFLKWIGLSFVLILIAGLVAFGFYVASVYYNAKSIPLNEEVLASPSLSISIFDSENKPIKEYNELNSAYAKIETLSPSTISAFTSIEDKSFYKHKGVNYKRIGKAIINNIKSRKLKEGASTITQQLVKNSQLTSEKTFDRKIKELALAKKVEAKYSKDQILEMYLNIIYFGNNCYGIENASNYYFSKQAKDLSLEEASLLAGMIKSPSKYSPIKNHDNALKRRNLVLSEMEKDGKISQQEFEKTKRKPITLSINNQPKNKLNSYSQACLDEAESLLGLPARQIAINGYKIYSYQIPEKQLALEEAMKKVEINCDSAGIVIDNSSHTVVAFVGDGNYKILESKRQPGSCLKPLLVYGPALNEDIIYPCTQLLDEKTTISEYTPKNVGDVYRGYVSARESLSKSINIPAVKVLSYVGIDKAKAYCEEMGIPFDEKDDSYALALGGMTYGTNILELASAYSTFACDGYYSKAKFVSFITDKNDKIVYINNNEEKRVFKEDSAYLLTDMLKSCAKTGTAKKLASLEKDIASKTGTVGKSGSKENLDAWNVSYTKNTTCAVWLGNLDNSPIGYAGGNQPTEIVKNYFEKVEDSSVFTTPGSIVERDIDLTELEENHRIVLANSFTPERYVQKELFSKFNLPSDVSNKFTSIEKPNFKTKVENNKIEIDFEAKDYLTYKFFSFDKNVAEFSSKTGLQKVSLELRQDKQIVEYEIFYTLSPEINYKDELKFVKTSKQQPTNKKWFI